VFIAKMTMPRMRKKTSRLSSWALALNVWMRRRLVTTQRVAKGMYERIDARGEQREGRRVAEESEASRDGC